LRVGFFEGRVAGASLWPDTIRPQDSILPHQTLVV